jgi:hypothetical protein
VLRLSTLYLNNFRHHPSLADYTRENLWLMARGIEWPLMEEGRYVMCFESSLAVCALVPIIISPPIIKTPALVTDM